MKNKITAVCSIVLCFFSYVSSAQKPYFETDDRLFFDFGSKAFAVKTINLATGVQLEYAEQGMAGGVPVIFLHGYTDSWHSFESILPHLPSSLHVFALTQRGHGNSSKDGYDYHPRDFAADVAAFIAEKQLDKVIIAGHSLGGVVAQQFALDYPQLVKAIILISTDPAYNDNPGMPEFMEEVSRLSDPVDYRFAESFQYSTIVRPVDSNLVKFYIKETLKVPARVIQAIGVGFMNVDYRKDLHKISQPVLVMWGDKDLICPRDGQDQFMKSIRKANLLVYEGTGHALHWEQPERFANDVIRFFDSLK